MPRDHPSRKPRRRSPLVGFHQARRGGLWANPPLNRVIGAVVNAIRSLPFIIPLVALISLTRLIVGTSIGTAAAMVPLSIAAIAIAPGSPRSRRGRWTGTRRRRSGRWPGLT